MGSLPSCFTATYQLLGPFSFVESLHVAPDGFLIDTDVAATVHGTLVRQTTLFAQMVEQVAKGLAWRDLLEHSAAVRDWTAESLRLLVPALSGSK